MPSCFGGRAIEELSGETPEAVQAILEDQVVHQEALFLQHVSFELASLAPSEWVEACRLRYALQGGIGPRSGVHRLGQSLGKPSGSGTHRVCSLEPCFQGQQCGHLRLVRVNSGLLPCCSGSSKVTCDVVPCCWSSACPVVAGVVDFAGFVLGSACLPCSSFPCCFVLQSFLLIPVYLGWDALWQGLYVFPSWRIFFVFVFLKY